MEAYTGLGAWMGQAEGRIVWVEPRPVRDRAPVADRAAEIARLREEMALGLAAIDRWMEQQATLGGRMILQQYREALQDGAFTGRVAMLIDVHGLPAPAALVEAADLVAGVMARSEELGEKAKALPVAARWLAGRLTPAIAPAGPSSVPTPVATPSARPLEGAILAAREFSPLELLDRTTPAIMAAGDPGVTGSAPLIWGLSALGPEWTGRPARIEGSSLVIGADGDVELAAYGKAESADEEALAMQYERARRAVIETAQRMMRDGLVRLTSGNVSCRIPGTNRFAITPSGMAYESLEPADICIVDLEGNLVDGARRPSTETPLHRLTYLRRPEINGVVHTHSIYASAFACTGQDLPVISTELAGLVGGTIRCAPYAPCGTEEFAQIGLDSLGVDEVALLFQNHGVLAIGRNLAEAYNVAIGLEEAAQIYFIAGLVGQPIILPETERRRIFKVMHTRYGQPGEGS